MIKLSKQEIKIILSALSNDTQGKWGDGRQELIDSAIAKVKELERKYEAIKELKRKYEAMKI